jgi:hypothetical protein
MHASFSHMVPRSNTWFTDVKHGFQVEHMAPCAPVSLLRTRPKHCWEEGWGSERWRRGREQEAAEAGVGQRL